MLLGLRSGCIGLLLRFGLAKVGESLLLVVEISVLPLEVEFGHKRDALHVEEHAHAPGGPRELNSVGEEVEQDLQDTVPVQVDAAEKALVFGALKQRAHQLHSPRCSLVADHQMRAIDERNEVKVLRVQSKGLIVELSLVQQVLQQGHRHLRLALHLLGLLLHFPELSLVAGHRPNQIGSFLQHSPKGSLQRILVALTDTRLSERI